MELDGLSNCPRICSLVEATDGANGLLVVLDTLPSTGGFEGSRLCMP